MKRTMFFLFFLLLMIGFVVRLYRFSNPIADWHSWRQSDTSAVSQNFIDYGFDPFHPRYYDISNVQSGKDNPQGYRFVEFPIYNLAQAGLFASLHIFTLEEWGRLISVFSSLLGSVFLFLIIKRHTKGNVSWFVFLFSLFLPYNIYYGRTILPDTSMVMTILGGIYFFDLWLVKYRKANSYASIFLLISLLFTAISLLLKPYALFYALPLLVLTFSTFRYRMFLRWQLWFYTFLSLLPLLLWRRYILAFPEGIPANMWLFNGNGIRFRPAFFRWIFYERLTKLISGYVGSVFLATGIIGIWKKESSVPFLLSFPISSLLYIIVFATGNVQHDYYQIVIMPSVALVMGFGVVWVSSLMQKYFSQWIAYGIVLVLIALSFFFSWQQVKDYFNINNGSIIIAGNAIQKLTPRNAKVIAPLDGDTTLLYAIKRKGWPSFEHDLPTLITMGADYLLLINPKPQDFYFATSYKIESSTSAYLLYNLHEKP